MACAVARLVAAFYAGIGAGRVPEDRRTGGSGLAARWLLAPYLAGAWLNSRWWTRRQPQPVQVADDVWIGRMPSARDLSRPRFGGIVDVSAEMSLPLPRPPRVVVPMLDLVTPDAASLAQAAREIEAMRARGRVLVCCALGYSRSACAVSAWLLSTGRASTVEQAFARVRSVRGEVVLNDAHANLLRMTLSDTIDDALAWRLRLTAEALAAVSTLDTLSTGLTLIARGRHRRRAVAPGAGDRARRSSPRR